MKKKHMGPRLVYVQAPLDISLLHMCRILIRSTINSYCLMFQSKEQSEIYLQFTLNKKIDWSNPEICKAI